MEQILVYILILQTETLLKKIRKNQILQNKNNNKNEHDSIEIKKKKIKKAKQGHQKPKK